MWRTVALAHAQMSLEPESYMILEMAKQRKFDSNYSKPFIISP